MVGETLDSVPSASTWYFIVIFYLLGNNLKQVLVDLKAIVYSPIKPNLPLEGSSTSAVVATADISDSDLPALINRVIGRRKYSLVFTYHCILLHIVHSSGLAVF